MLDGAVEDAEIALAPYNPAASFPVGDITCTFTGADAAAGLELAAPDADLRLVLDPVNAPDMRVATLVPALFAADALVGVGEQWPTWVEGEIGASYAEIGLVAGWNAVYIDPSHQLNVVDPLALLLPPNMTPVTELAISGGIAPGAAGFVGAFLGVEAYAEVSAQDAWSLSLVGDPGASGELAAFGATGALLGLGVFDDADTSGGWSAGDPVVHGVCAGAVPVYAAWLDPADDIAAALERQRRGYSNGWNTVSAPDTAEVLSADGLAADPSCPAP